MTRETEKYLVVLSVIEGKRFPKRPKHKLVIEAKFDGELLSSDPVDHVETPDITQELAWEVDRKGLQQHRLQRTSIKVQCYAKDMSTTAKEQIGYIVLDLRLAQAKQTNKWYQLLNSKYSKSKPEICLGLYLDEDKGTTAVGQPSKDKLSVSMESFRKSPSTTSLRPVLDEAQGLYQIGPPGACTDHFLLSVTIAFASNLGQLIPSSIPLPSSSFFFYYSLFGNDVTNEVFNNLLNPNFPVERSSVKIHSNVDVLTKFFSSQPGLKVHLCCGDQSLGSCEVPLNCLLKSNSTEIFMRPVTVEGSYQLIPPNKVKAQLPPFNSDTAPVVGITIVLKKEDTIAVKPTPTGDILDGSYLESISPDKKLTWTKNSDKKSEKEGDIRKEKEDGVEKYSDDFEQENSCEQPEQHPTVSHLRGNMNHLQLVQNNIEPSTKPQQNSTVSTTQREVHSTQQASSQPNHFTFTIDLRSVRDVSQQSIVNIFLRYTYPFFGSAAPITTHPPTVASPGQEVLLPQSFCAFDFACSLQQLQETFLRVPLLVELWHKDLTLGKDCLLGTSQLPLSLILTAEKTRLMNNGQTGLRQVHSDRLPIRSVGGEGDNCGELTFVLSLEDWGPIDTNKLTNSNQQNVDATHEPRNESEGVSNARETAEYQAAVELELWKESQEQIFDNQLKQKETTYMRALAEEWKRRDRDREIIVQKKIAEYSHLEEQLRKTLIDLEKREKLLDKNEQEMIRLRRDLQHEHERKLQEMREASRRLKDDCDHQVSLERGRITEMEASIARHKHEFKESLHKYELLEREFALHKEQQSHTPEVKLQSEINVLTLEKVELDRKLDTAIKSKVHYKQQWGRALKELARLKQREQELAKAQLKRQQEELEQMRLRYLAAEEKEVIGGERRELEDIKNELNRLRLLEEQKTNETNETEERLKSAGGDAANSPHRGVPLNSSEEKMTRLIDERDTLLRTGVYTTQDTIIAKLERQIRECIATNI